MKFRILCRYEYMGEGGKTWTKWYKYPMEKWYDTEKEAKARAKELKDSNKQRKYSYEFDCEEFDDVEYEKTIDALWEKERKKAERAAKREAKKNAKD